MLQLEHRSLFLVPCRRRPVISEWGVHCNIIEINAQSIQDALIALHVCNSVHLWASVDYMNAVCNEINAQSIQDCSTCTCTCM